MRGLKGTPTNRIRLASLATLALFVVVMAAQVAINRDAVVTAVHPASTDTVTLELLAYYVSNGLLLIPYVGVVLFCIAHPIDRAMMRLLIGTPIVVLIGLLVVPPTFSIDTYSYIAHGVTGMLVGGGDPYSVQPSQVLFLPIGQALHNLGWLPPPAPSPYGPAWSIVEVVVARLPLDIAGQVFLFKAIAAAATLASGGMIWRILGRIRPGQRVAGTVLFLWNPVVLIELAGDGHNDALMILFVLVAIDALLRSQISRSMVATMFGILVKYLPLILAPPMAIYELRRNGHDGLVRRVAGGAAISVAVAILVFLPFWTAQTFAAVLRSNGGGAWPLWPTVGGVIQAVLAGRMIDSSAALLKTAGLDLLFVVYVARQSWRVHDVDSLIRAMANIAFVYMFAVSAIFYPWYIILPLVLFALTETRSALLLVLTMTVASRIDGPLAAYLFPQLRPAPRDPAHGNLVFITQRGRGPFCTGNPHSTLGQSFKRLLLRVGIDRKKLGFSSLRKTFRTIADSCQDPSACALIMGHGAKSSDMGARYTQKVDRGRLVDVVEHVRHWLWPDTAATYFASFQSAAAAIVVDWEQRPALLPADVLAAIKSVGIKQVEVSRGTGVNQQSLSAVLLRGKPLSDYYSSRVRTFFEQLSRGETPVPAERKVSPPIGRPGDVSLSAETIAALGRCPLTAGELKILIRNLAEFGVTWRQLAGWWEVKFRHFEKLRDGQRGITAAAANRLRALFGVPEIHEVAAPPVVRVRLETLPLTKEIAAVFDRGPLDWRGLDEILGILRQQWGVTRPDVSQRLGFRRDYLARIIHQRCPITFEGYFRAMFSADAASTTKGGV